LRTDLAVLRFFHSQGEPYLTAVVNVLEAIFSPEVLLSVAALAGFALLLLGRSLDDFEVRFSGIVLLATAFGTGALTGLFKILFHRPRPPSSLQLVHEIGYGFPSAHAVAVVTIGAALWYLCGLRSLERWGGSWQARARIGVAVVALGLLVGLGRMHSGGTTPATCWPGGPSTACGPPSA